MFNEEPEFIIKDNEDKCEGCNFYIGIDSGYGYCRRFPPKTINIGRWWKPKWKISYLGVEWCRKACGEFRRRN